MSLKLKTFELDDATLSGGAQIKSAAGGLPRRITCADDILLEGVTYANFCGFDWVDNDTVWISDYLQLKLRKIRVSDQVVLDEVDTSPGRLMGLDAYGGSLFACNYASQLVEERDISDGSVIRSFSTVPYGEIDRPSRIITLDGVNVWVNEYGSAGGPVEEYVMATGLPTGRSVGSAAAAKGLAHDRTNGRILVANTGGTKCSAFNESDLAEVSTFDTLYSAYRSDDQNWFQGFNDAIEYDEAGGLVYVVANIWGTLEAYTPAGVYSHRAMWATGHRDRIVSASSFTEAADILRFSPDGTLAAIQTGRADVADTQPVSFLVKRTGTQRARWSWTPGSAVTVQRIMVPGIHGNIYSDGFDHRRCRFYYSTDGGSTRVEFTPGSPLSLALGALDTLLVDADMTVWGHPTGLPAWLAGDAGEGPAILYNDPNAIAPSVAGTVAGTGPAGTPVASGPSGSVG